VATLSSGRTCYVVTLLILLLAGFVITFAEAGKPTQTPVRPVVPIDAPLLVNSVNLDGRFTTPNEWSDATVTSMLLRCVSEGCSNAPVDSVNMTVSAKNDGTWLYLFYRFNWTTPTGSDPFDLGGSLNYWWSQSGASPYKYHNVVNTWLGYAFGEGWEDPANPGVWNSDPGGKRYHAIEGFGRRENNGYGYSFEFRTLLSSGDPLHWSLSPGKTYGVYGTDGLMFVQFCANCSADDPLYLQFQRSITLSLLTTAGPRTTTSTSTETTTAVTTVPQMTAATTSQLTSQGPSTTTGQLAVVSQTQFFGLFGLVGSIAVIAVVASVLVLKRRRKTTTAPTVTLEPKPAGPVPLPPRPSSQPSVPTGYAELDSMLGGGLPERYAVVILSQSFDELDLLIRKSIESSVASGRPTFYLSNEVSKTLDFVMRFRQNFYVLNPMAERIAPALGNLFKIPDVSDLSGLNISANKIIESKTKDQPSKMIIIDLLSDVLLKNKGLTTRRWLTDFAAKRKGEGFTILATLDPSVAPKEDVQAITGAFDGVLEVYERPLQERSRRFMIIKKMYGRDYSENELMLDRQKLQ